jgi:hypothetical protein
MRPESHPMKSVTIARHALRLMLAGIAPWRPLPQPIEGGCHQCRRLPFTTRRGASSKPEPARTQEAFTGNLGKSGRVPVTW